MWNIEEIKTRKRSVIYQLKKCSNKKEREKLEITLATYISMLDNSGTIRYTKFYNWMDKLTKGKFTLIKPSTKLIVKGESIINENKDYIDIDYLSFLLELSKNISSTESVVKNFSDIIGSKFNFNNNDLIKISKLFYSSLNDKEIYECAKKIIDDTTALNFTTEYASNYKEAGGITFWDYVYNKAYCTTIRNKTLFDLQANNHEIMHGIDFYMQQKIPTENYYGFHEIPTYFIDYLFINYLETLGLDKNEVQKLRVKKDANLQNLSYQTNIQIKNQLVMKKGLFYLKNFTTEDIMEVMTPNILKNLLEIQSGVIAYGLNKQFEENYELGLNNLKTFMKTIIPKDKRPNFSKIGLNENKLINLSFEIGNYSKKYQNNNIKNK